MKKLTFTHLHAHSCYSLLDSSNKIKDYINKVKELGMTSAAITDHGSMYGVIEFYKSAKAAGIHPIIGCEVYVTAKSMKDKSDNILFHLVLLAENNIGYANLMHLVSKAFVEGFYYYPRIDLEALEKHHEGLIALSGCLAGEVAKKLTNGDYKGACKAAYTYHSIFGANNFFLELQDHGIPLQKEINKNLVLMSKELNIPLVATNNIHYTNREDAKAHDVLLCIKTGKSISNKHRMKFEGDQFYVKSAKEMATLFPYALDALENTELISHRCKVEINFKNYHLPKFQTPPNYTSWEYLNKLCLDGLEKRYPNYDLKLKEQLDYELSIIQKMGYIDYFLIVWDIIRYAKENNIAVGPGRGSAAGSIVSYTLEITDIDPIKYNLLFERFLNPERLTMPDIDIGATRW